MKLLIWILILHNCLLTFIYADTQHKKHIHQYIVQQAYLLLEEKYQQAGGNINDLLLFKNGLFDSNGNPYIGNDIPHSIAYDAWSEDDSDSVWGRTIPSITHFWDADLGENNTYDMGLSTDVHNAWTKARSLLFLYNGYGHNWLYRDGHLYRCFPLINFFETGFGYKVDSKTADIPQGYPPIAFDLMIVRPIAMEMLGRISHLLADMSVPAHVHSDGHAGCNFCAWLINNDDLNKSSYEEWCGSNLESWLTSYNDGRVIGDDGFMPYIICYDDYEAMYHLFYTMNQITQHFPSDDKPGNNITPMGTNELIMQKFSAWGDSPSQNNVSHNDIALKTFDFCIGATASLFYWFGIRTGILKTTISDIYFDQAHKIGGVVRDTNYNPSTLTIKAENSITFQPGFRFKAVSPNGSLKAIINPCE